MVAANGNRGSGFSPSAAAKISAMVCPVLAKNSSARSGLILMDTRSPLLSSSDGSARLIDGISLASRDRDHGMSIAFGFWMVAMPTAPAAFRYFQRSPADE